MAWASAAAMIPCFSSMRQWAREPARSCAHRRLSTPMETLMACMMSAGLALKRPPHRDWPCEGESCCGLEGVSDMSGSGRTWAGVATFAVIGVIGMGAALLYVNQKGGGKESAPPAAQPAAQPLEPQLAAFAKGSLAALQAPASPAAPDYVFKAADGADVRLADF